MITTERLRIAFEYFYSRFYSDDKYKFNYSKTSLKTAESFIAKLSKKNLLAAYGVDFIWQYTVFQFSFWEDITQLTTPSGRIEFNLIFGIKALDRWFNRDIEKDWLNYESTFITRRNISTEKLKELLVIPEKDIVKYNNPVRASGLGKDYGFNNCIEFTTLYDHNDISCNICPHKEDCKELLRINYPQIYKKRGYARKVVK